MPSSSNRSIPPTPPARLVAALAVAVMASVLAGCGGDPETQAGDTTTTGIGGTATTAAADGSDPTSSGPDSTASGETTTSGATTATTAADAGTTSNGSSTTSNGATTTTSGEPEPATGPYPEAELAVTVSHPDHGDVAYTITCGGNTAGIAGDGAGIDAAAACLALTDPGVVRRLTTGPENRACTQQYGGPDVASLTGAIDGTAVRAAVDRKDGCGIADWDRLLADLLPEAAGLR